jgi:glycosyltransferase involved in cell wall biosynthesis
VTTDVSDAAEIVGDTGIVVPPNDPQALARGWEQIINLTAQERVRLGEGARERIRSHYEIQQIAKRYKTLYAEITRTG